MKALDGEEEADNSEFTLMTKDVGSIDGLLNATTQRDVQGQIKGPGQTALNPAVHLEAHGVVEKYGIRVLETPILATITTEGREPSQRRRRTGNAELPRTHAVRRWVMPLRRSKPWAVLFSSGRPSLEAGKMDSRVMRLSSVPWCTPC